MPGTETIAKDVAKDLDRVTAMLGAEAGKAFLAAYNTDVAGGIGVRTSIDSAMSSVRKTFERTGAGWVKRDAGPGMADDESVYACGMCNRKQPACRCDACGTRGPGAFCYACQSPTRMNCPGCGGMYRPILADDMQAEQRMLIVTQFDIREMPDKGEILGWANSELKDSHGTIIPPEEVLKHLKRGVMIDEEHDFKQIPGVEFVEAHAAKRPVKDDAGVERMVEGVGFTLRFNLGVAKARAVWQRIKDGLRKGFSIAFNMPQRIKDALKAGTTDVIDTLSEVPFLSIVSDPSNSAARLLEMRAKAPDRVAEAPKADEPPVEPKPAEDKPDAKAPDQMDQMRKAVAALGADEGAPPAPDSPDAATTPSAETRMAEALASITSRVDQIVKDIAAQKDVTALFAELRAALDKATADVTENTVSLTTLRSAQDAHAARINQLIDAVQTLSVKIVAYVRAEILKAKGATRKGEAPVVDALDLPTLRALKKDQQPNGAQRPLTAAEIAADLTAITVKRF